MMVGGHRPARVGSVMRTSSASVNGNATTRPILAAMDAAGIDELPVVTDGGAFLGMVVRRVVERRLYDRGDADATADALAEPPLARAAPDERIEDAVDAMLSSDLDVMPVVSSGGQLDGLLVLADLKHVPGLVEAVAEDRRQRALDGEAGATKLIVACSLASALLGVVLFAMWVSGPAYGLPRWVAWIDGTVAALALIGAGTAFAHEMISVPVWAISGIGLCFAASIAHAWNRGAWSTWVQFALAVAFLSMATLIGSRWPRRRQAALRTA